MALTLAAFHRQSVKFQTDTDLAVPVATEWGKATGTRVLESRGLNTRTGRVEV